MNKKLFSGLLLIFFAVPAFASIPDFKTIDTNNDGSISQMEAITAGISKQLFAKLDLNGDKKLSADEYNALTEGQS